MNIILFNNIKSQLHDKWNKRLITYDAFSPMYYKNIVAK